MKRWIDDHLEAWARRPSRKVLLLRGARQVGKTYAVRRLGAGFEHFVELNLDVDPRLHTLFERTLDATEIVRALELWTNRPIEPGRTLLFFDEIQSCPKAIHALRYFHERLPGLHVVAAGSLLEFALEELASFGVGRVESMYLHPLGFPEYLAAVAGPGLVEAIREASPARPVQELVHLKILEEFRRFSILGGLPEVVQTFLDTGRPLECQRLLRQLLQGYQADFSRYHARVPTLRLQETLVSVAAQTGAKFKYSSATEGPGLPIKDALSLLGKAGLVHLAFHASGNGIPLQAEADPKRFKAFLFDSGLFQQLLELDLDELVLGDGAAWINRGPLAEVVTACEWIRSGDPLEPTLLHYWHREARSSLAEVDFLLPLFGRVVPAEVKSGSGRRMKSLRIFLDEKHSPLGLRLCADNFSRSDRVVSVPIYATAFLRNYPWLRELVLDSGARMA